MPIHEMYDINLIQFTDNSLKPASTEIMAKLNKVITIFTTPTRRKHQYGNTNAYSFSHQQQQHGQFQRMPRHQHGTTYGGSPWGEVPWGGEEENNSEVQVTIKETRISILIGRVTYVLNRSDGKWSYVVTATNYKESLSHYTSLLCEEIIAGSK